MICKADNYSTKGNNMALNLDTLAVAETTRVHLADALGEKLYDNDQPVEIEIYGKGSKAHKQALAELNRKSMQRKGKPQNLAVIMEDNADYLASISKASYNLDHAGAPVDSYETFKNLYMNTKLFFIKDQVQEALDDNANFTTK